MIQDPKGIVRFTTRRNIQAGEVFTTDLRLVPRNPDGTVQGWARGDYSLVYKHRDDLHSTPTSMRSDWSLFGSTSTAMHDSSVKQWTGRGEYTQR